jgi:adenylate cyclase
MFVYLLFLKRVATLTAKINSSSLIEARRRSLYLPACRWLGRQKMAFKTQD